MVLFGAVMEPVGCGTFLEVDHWERPWDWMAWPHTCCSFWFWIGDAMWQTGLILLLPFLPHQGGVYSSRPRSHLPAPLQKNFLLEVASVWSFFCRSNRNKQVHIATPQYHRVLVLRPPTGAKLWECPSPSHKVCSIACNWYTSSPVL